MTDKLNDNWRNNLPAGFEPVYTSSRPFISFDARHYRFYFSSGALQDLGLKPGNRIGMAYNKSDDTIIVVTSGNGMLVDKKSYVTSRYFAQIAGFKDGLIEYEYIPEESSEQFKYFRRAIQ